MQGLDTNTHELPTAQCSLKGTTGLVYEEILLVKGNKKIWKIRGECLPPPQFECIFIKSRFQGTIAARVRHVSLSLPDY